MSLRPHQFFWGKEPSWKEPPGLLNLKGHIPRLVLRFRKGPSFFLGGGQDCYPLYYLPGYHVVCGALICSQGCRCVHVGRRDTAPSSVQVRPDDSSASAGTRHCRHPDTSSCTVHMWVRPYACLGTERVVRTIPVDKLGDTGNRGTRATGGTGTRGTRGTGNRGTRGYWY